jgi:murein DD-endopeptidase MepM/ murein hydrolase activator NlpD
VALALVIVATAGPGEKKPLPSPYRDHLLREAREVRVAIGPGDFCAGVLERAGMSPGEAARLVSDVRPVYDLKDIHSGRGMTLFFEDGRLRNLLYAVDRDRLLEVRGSGEGFAGRVFSVPYDVRLETVRIRIDNSLYEATMAAGELMELFEPLSRMFEYDVDFNRDIRPGDTVTALLQKKYLGGKLAAYGDILAAEMVNNGETIRVVRYPAPEGGDGYYYPDGRSIRRMFLRSPLPFIRVTSRYGMRKHPVLGFSRQHNGTDFGAPAGTPVRATASGTVKAVGRDNGRGRYVIIRHGNGFVTHYYHLSSFARGLRSGQRVSQGQLIGAVGSSGLSTGPHLHYGLQQNGRYLDALRLKSPKTSALPAERLAAFREHCDKVLARIESPFRAPVLAKPGFPESRDHFLSIIATGGLR